MVQGDEEEAPERDARGGQAESWAAKPSSLQGPRRVVRYWPEERHRDRGRPTEGGFLGYKLKDGRAMSIGQGAVAPARYRDPGPKEGETARSTAAAAWRARRYLRRSSQREALSEVDA